jgi:hypothetical protein
MSRSFLTGINLNKNELLNARIQNLANDPLNPVLGQVYFNTSLNEMRVYNGAEFEAVGLNGVTAVASEVNILDGAIITTDELNTLDDINTGTTVQAQLNLKAPIDNPTFTGNVSLVSNLIFEGETPNEFETTVTSIDPTADRTITLPDASGTVILSTDTVSDLAAPTGAFSMNSQKITSLAEPTEASDAATKAYVDNVAEGIHVKPAVLAATTGNLTATYANGTSGIDATLNLGPLATLNIDGVTTWAVEDGVLVKDQTTTFENGRYYIFQVGDETTDWIFKRCSACDEPDEIPSSYVFVQGGNTYASTGWVALVSDPADFTVGVDGVEWVQFSGAGTYLAGTGLTLDGETFNVGGTSDRISVTSDAVDIASTYVGQTSITTLGTVTTGTWEGSAVGVAYGGTGAANAAGAKTNLGFMTRYAESNDLLISITGVITWAVTHNLGTRDVTVAIYDINTNAEVEVDVVRTNTNVVTLSWVSTTDVAADSYRVVIIG